MNNELINVITLVVTLFGFYFAYYQWYRASRERKFHILKLLKVQLDCMGPWVGSTGSGYGECLTEEQLFDNANPFKLIYATGSTPLIDSTLLEQMSDVPECIIGEIDQLHYDFKRIESIQEYRNQLTSSDLELSFSISNKLTEAGAKGQRFATFISKLTESEAKIVSVLITYGENLHCVVIGNKDRGARQHWEAIRQWIGTEISKYKKPQWMFIALSLGVFLGILYVINSYWRFTDEILSIALISFLLTLFVSIKSQAMIFNNEMM